MLMYADENPFALAVLMAKAAFSGKKISGWRERDSVLLETKLRLMHAMIGRDIPEDRIRSLIIFLTYYVNFHLSALFFIGRFDLDFNVIIACVEVPPFWVIQAGQ